MKERGFMPVTRRSALFAIGAAVSWPAIFAGWPHRPGARLPADRLRAVVPCPDCARAIGARYRRAFPAEADTDELARILLASLPLPEESPSDEPDRLRERVASVIRRDFSEERTAVVDGWILSRTEARLCALWA